MYYIGLSLISCIFYLQTQHLTFLSYKSPCGQEIYPFYHSNGISKSSKSIALKAVKCIFRHDKNLQLDELPLIRVTL